MILRAIHRLTRRSPGIQEAEIVLTWLVRLRWLAVAGQLTATLVAAVVLRLNPPLGIILGVVLVTVGANLALQRSTVLRWRVAWIVPAVLLLDVALLTALLMCTGGPANPFSALYLVHVAMAVVALGEGWTWIIVATIALCYGSLFFWHLPLSRGKPLPASVMNIGNWTAVTLVAVVIAFFIGQVKRSLRRHEAALAAARDGAARNEKLAALTTLAAGAAHELNTPLATIAVVAKEMELAAGRGQAAGSLEEDARLIRREVDRCRTILAGMRVDVLEGRAQPAAPMSLAAFVDGVRREIDPLKRQRLRVRSPAAGSTLALPWRAIQQAIGILIDNALCASGDAGEVRLDVDLSDGEIRFQVSDRGAGMSEEVLRRAGEPFFTTKPPGQGMGLGLYLARTVAEKLGGRLELQSSIGGGTRATMRLPFLESDIVHPTVPASAAAAESTVGAA